MVLEYADQIPAPKERELVQSVALFRTKRSSSVSLGIVSCTIGWDAHNLELGILKRSHLSVDLCFPYLSLLETFANSKRTTLMACLLCQR